MSGDMPRGLEFSDPHGHRPHCGCARHVPYSDEAIEAILGMMANTKSERTFSSSAELMAWLHSDGE